MPGLIFTCSVHWLLASGIAETNRQRSVFIPAPLCIRMAGKGMALQLRQGDMIQDPAVGGGKDHRRGNVVFRSFFPSVDTQAPAVSRFKTREAGRWEWGAQVVAPGFGKFQENGGHLGTDTMPADVAGADAALTVAQKTGQWIEAACLKRFTEHVRGFLGCHKRPPLEILCCCMAFYLLKSMASDGKGNVKRVTVR